MAEGVGFEPTDAFDTPLVFKTSTISQALSTFRYVVREVGFEPTMFTTWVSGLQPDAFSHSATPPKKFMAEAGGIEPPTRCLQDNCSTN